MRKASLNRRDGRKLILSPFCDRSLIELPHRVDETWIIMARCADTRDSKQYRPPLPPPHVLATLVPDSPAFAELMKIETRLDWTLLRKKAEINDALGRPVRVRAILVNQAVLLIHWTGQTSSPRVRI